MTRRVVISAGHALKVRGASGSPIPPYMDEYNENVRVVNKVWSLLPPEAQGGMFIDTHSTSQNQNLNAIVNYHNSRTRDLDVSVHFNAAAQTASLQGTEVLHHPNTSSSNKQLAASLSSAMAGVGTWPNRGAKPRGDLFFLNSTNKPAILIETCFVTSSGDASHYNAAFDELCRTIAEQIIGASLTPPGPEPEPTPEPEPPSIAITITGDVLVTINGQLIDITTPPAQTTLQQNIIATVFSGDGSPGAYGIPIPSASSSAKYLAVPWKDQAIKNKPARVTNRANGKSDVGEVWDLGPWCTSDNYPAKKTRPIAEIYEGKPMPALPEVPAHNVGKISNGAGIDLSPALAAAIGIDGKGFVDWDWEELTS